MFRKHSTVYITSLAALILILACVTTPVVPTQGAVSTTDPNQFSTMVAEAAGALMTQTAAAQPVLPLSSPTASLPVETPVAIMTEAPVTSQGGTSLSQLEDGSTQFVDYIAGIRLRIPAGWVTVRLNEPEYNQIWELTVDNPVLKQGLEDLQTLDPARYRLHAFNTQPDYVYMGEGSQINVAFIQNDARTLEQVAEDEAQPKAFTEYTLISSEFQVWPESLELFIIEKQWRKMSVTDALVMIYYRGAIVKVPSGTVIVELFAPFDISHEVVPVFDQMVVQMVLFTP